MKLEIVTFDQAKALKELGFDWDTYAYYELDDRLGERITRFGIHPQDNNSEYSVSAPTVALSLKYLREEKGFRYTIDANEYEDERCKKIECWMMDTLNLPTLICETYEEAESAALTSALTLLENEVD